MTSKATSRCAMLSACVVRSQNSGINEILDHQRRNDDLVVSMTDFRSSEFDGAKSFSISRSGEAVRKIAMVQFEVIRLTSHSMAVPFH